MRRFFLELVVVAATLVAAQVATPAAAQPRASFSTVRFTPAMGPDNYLALEGTRVLPDRKASYGLGFDYANDALVVAHPCRGLRNVLRCRDGQLARDSFLPHTALAHLSLALGLLGHTQLSVDLPLGGTEARGLTYEVNDAGGANPFRELAPRDGFALGDLRVSAKRVLYEQRARNLRIAGSAFATLPTALLTSDRDCRRGGTCTFLGERGMQIGASGIAELAPVRDLRVAGQLGLTYRPQRDFSVAETGTELNLGVAGAYALWRTLVAKLEVAAAFELAGFDDTPVEARGGVSYGRDLLITAGVGAGIVGDVGSPRYRLFAGVQWSPTVHDLDGDRIDDGDDACPRVPEDRDGIQDRDGCPDDDDDRDGLPDAKDGCDHDPEDRDGFLDEDGCPDPDNDGDGVLDGYDSCEGEQEDRDGDHDDDGCADLDSDRDGVGDQADECPREAEDTDGLADEDGCPEADLDADGVPDTDDACPEQPQGKKLPRAEKGCPR